MQNNAFIHFLYEKRFVFQNKPPVRQENYAEATGQKEKKTKAPKRMRTPIEEEAETFLTHGLKELKKIEPGNQALEHRGVASFANVLDKIAELRSSMRGNGMEFEKNPDLPRLIRDMKNAVTEAILSLQPANAKERDKLVALSQQLQDEYLGTSPYHQDEAYVIFDKRRKELMAMKLPKINMTERFVQNTPVSNFQRLLDKFPDSVIERRKGSYEDEKVMPAYIVEKFEDDIKEKMIFYVEPTDPDEQNFLLKLIDEKLRWLDNSMRALAQYETRFPSAKKAYASKWTNMNNLIEEFRARKEHIAAMGPFYSHQ